MANTNVAEIGGNGKFKVPECFTAFNMWIVYGKDFSNPYSDLIELLPAYQFVAKAIDREIADSDDLAIGAGRILAELNKRLRAIANNTETLQYPEDTPDA
jgi:hypothetical protein